MMKILKNEKGITLMVLVVTIIVLLILAGVTIATLSGDNGLLGRAQEAKEAAEDSEIGEKIQLAMIKAEQNTIEELKKEDIEKELKKQFKNIDTEVIVVEGEFFIKIKNKLYDQDGNVAEIKTLEDYGVKVGDYANYTPKVKTLTADSQVIKDLQEYSGYTGTDNNTQTQIQQENLRWRVLDVKNNKLRLISNIPTTSKVLLSKYDGYNNGVYLLDELCRELYSSEQGSAQNLKIEDVEKYLTYDYTQFQDFDIPIKYGETKEYTGSIRYPNILSQETNYWVDGNRGTKYGISQQDSLIKGESQTNSSLKITQTLWQKTGNVLTTSDFTDETYLNIFAGTGNDTYWLSSRWVSTETKYNKNIMFDLHRICYRKSYVNDVCYYMYSTAGKTNRTAAYGFRPVITLSKDVQIYTENLNTNGSASKPYNIK